MSKSTKQQRRQLAVLEDLFTGTVPQPEVLAKHHVRPSLFERWLTDARFARQFEQRIVRAQRQNRAFLARCAVAAATKLGELIKSKNVETARKACLDILSLASSSDREEPCGAQPQPAGTPTAPKLSPETVSRLLAALAREEPRAKSDSVWECSRPIPGGSLFRRIQNHTGRENAKEGHG